MPAHLDVPAIRRRFPGLARQVHGRPAVFADGPAGSQVPQSVADAVLRQLLHDNANHGGPFATSRATDAMVDSARAAFADWYGGAADEIVFGANMTTLTFQLARALARRWRPGDEILVTDSDHDANVTPWVRAARETGAVVHRVDVRGDGTLDPDDYARKLSPRTVLVAFGATSNLTGTMHPVAAMAAAARAHGAATYIDAVHHAAHARIDVAAWGCDFAVSSAYKFFGPHVGILWGRAALLRDLEADKVRPAPDSGPGKWEPGTANFEGIAGARAAVDYVAQLGRDVGCAGDRRACLDAAFAAIGAHERQLCARLLAGLLAIPGLRVVGIADPARIADRVATVSFVHPHHPPRELCHALAEQGIFAWAGNSYALPLTQALGLEPDGVLRLGFLHYHTLDEVDVVVAALRRLLACA
jgi:cysteine desulfurase family protein (TIGR01976 family)